MRGGSVIGGHHLFPITALRPSYPAENPKSHATYNEAFALGALFDRYGGVLRPERSDGDLEAERG